MSGFYCEHCGAAIINGDDGRTPTECEHYPIKKEEKGESEVGKLFGFLGIK